MLPLFSLSLDLLVDAVNSGQKLLASLLRRKLAAVSYTGTLNQEGASVRKRSRAVKLQDLIDQ